MRLPSLTVRTRLAVWYVLSILVLAVCYAAAVLTVVRRDGALEADEALRTELAQFVDLHQLGQALPGMQSPTDSFVRSEPRQATVDMWRQGATAGTWVDGTRLRGIGPGVPPVTRFLPGADEQPFDVFRAGVRWRAVRAVSRAPDGTTVLFEVSLSMGAADAAYANLQRSAGWGLALLLVLGCGGGLFIASAALRPVNDIIQRTRAFGPGQLSARLPQPARDDEIGKLSAVINDLLERLQTALRKEARFATEAAHELRTPLTAQRAVGEMVLRGSAGTRELRDAVSTMLEEGEHMHKLVDSLLLVARAEGGLLPNPQTPCDVVAVAERCVRSMRPLTESKEQTLELVESRPVQVLADETLLRQALLNLIHNAIEHTPAGTRIAVKVQVDPSRGVLTTVMDNGPGFAVFEEEQVVRRHGRRQPERQYRGLGLGLTIARAIVRSQGGRMDVSSTPGLGTTVVIVLPEAGGSSHDRPPRAHGLR